MGKPILFRGKCCNSSTEQQRKSLRKACLSDDVIDSYVCGQVLNTCGKTPQEVLEEFPLYAGSQSYTPGDRVVRLEDDGYSIVVYETGSVIPSSPAIFNSLSWSKICEIRISQPSDGLSIEQIYSTYSEYSTDIPEGEEYYYRQGDIVYFEEECGDAICLYSFLQDLPINEQTSPLPPSPKDIEIAQREYCISTGVNKCLESSITKDPALAYELIRIGTLGHFVQKPVPYALSPNPGTLDSQVSRESPKVLTQKEIDILDGILGTECAED